MIEAIKALEQDREQWVLNAIKTAEKNFKVSRIVNSLENIFQEAIEFEKQKLADAQSLPFEDNSFELLLSCKCLEHVPEPQLVLNLNKT